MTFSKLAKIFLIIFLISIYVFPVQVSAKTAQEIQQEIDAKQKELGELNSKLKAAENQLSSSQSSKTKSLSQVGQVQAQLAEVQSQLEINQLNQEKLQQEIELKELQKQGLLGEQDAKIAEAYMDWKVENITTEIFTSEDIVKTAVYHDFETQQRQQGILGISTELDGLNHDNDQYQNQISDLEKQKTAYDDQKKALEDQIAKLNGIIASGNSNKSYLNNQITGVKAQIDQLTEQQRAIEAADDNLTNNSTNGGTKQIIAGQIYFQGTGRDAKQGHGVGMSQYGAKGLADNGRKYDEILKFYYTGVTLADYSATTQITIVYCTNNHNGLTPPGYGSPSCSSGQVAMKKIGMDDYLGGLGEMPESWPMEARKAQIVAARTYALRYTGNGNSPICITTSCQVSYLRPNPTDDNFMDDGDLPVAQATSGKVMTYNGAFISAVYSSDNNQGYGTANNDTRWSNFSGSGSAYPYLRSVNDNALAAKTQWTNWAWRTNSYTTDSINAMFQYSADHYTTSGSNSFLKNLKSGVGTINALAFDRDASNRVKVVHVYGDKGNKPIAGWLFMAIWNNWVANVKPTGQTDYIYSLTWFMKTG